jgi:3-oxoacyl-[acyl-carrier protein] reductase
MDILDISGRTALVTGASGGLGAALVDRLLREGVRVIGTTRQLERLAPRSERFIPVEVDMGEVAAIPELARQLESEYGSIDLLVANAGRGVVRVLDEVTLDEWQHTMNVNVTAPFLLAQALAPGMVAREFGRILFVSSAAAFVGGFVGPHYAASKAALHGLVHVLSVRLAPAGVTANAIAPALLDGTGMVQDAPAAARATRPPVGRLGRPEEVADLAVAVLRNGYVSGQVILADGGIYPN